ncbi:MAG: ATP-grasp domain-containing protein [Chlorobiales bacterium]|nr:ATP-grasp domain-containing protein [Chlorobiales bacterium]
MKVALLYNQKPVAISQAERYATDEFAEWDNPETIEAIASALRERFEVVLVDCHPEKVRDIIDVLLKERPDICFNIVEGAGTASRESQIPALLDMLGLKYTASDVLTLATTLDKARTKEVLAYHKIPTPAFYVVYDASELPEALSDICVFPMIVKPLHEGSSKGVFERSVVYSVEELYKQVQEVLHEYRQPALVEQFLEGREFTVAMLGNDDEVEVLPIVEICFDNLPKETKRIYSYEAKWLWDDPNKPVDVFQCPANVPADMDEQIKRVSKDAYRALRCRDWARIDVRLDSRGVANILEVNPLPGVLPNPDEHSCFPMAARAAGMSYSQLINRVLDNAIKRYNAYISK